MGADHAEPLIDFPAKESVFRVDPAAQLLSGAAGRKQRNEDLSRLEDPTLPGNPDVEVKNSGRVGKSDDDLALHWDAMLVDPVTDIYLWP